MKGDTRTPKRHHLHFNTGEDNNKVDVDWATFETTIGFRIDDHITDYFSRVDIKEARSHKTALEEKQKETSQELQSYVTTNYEDFINISTEIMNIEGDMAKLTNILGSYRGIMKSLQHTKFDFSELDDEEGDDGANAEEDNNNTSDMAFAHSGIAGGGAEAARSDIGGEAGCDRSSRSDFQIIHDLCEEVRIMVAQSKFEEAVTKITEARGMLKKLMILDKISTDEKGRFLKQRSSLAWDYDNSRDSLSAQGSGGGGLSAMSSMGGSFKGNREDGELREFNASLHRLNAAIEKEVRHIVDALQAELRRVRDVSAWDAGNLGGIRIIRYFLRLGQSDEALHILLKTRHSALNSEIRRIKFQGDASQYVNSLSEVVFQGISDCIEEFRIIFPKGKEGNAMISTVVQWVIEELGDFVRRFETQVTEARSNFIELGECLRCAFRACSKLDLQGLNLSFVLAKRLHPIVQEYIDRAMRSVVAQIIKPGGEISKEQWLSKKLLVKELETDANVTVDKKSEGGDGPSHSNGDSKASSPREGPANNSSSSSNNNNNNNKAAKKKKKKSSSKKREIKLTSSAQYLYNAVRTLLEADLSLVVDDNVLPEATIALYGTVAKGVIGLLDEAITFQAKKATKIIPKEKEAQHLSIIANFQYLRGDLLPRVEKSISSLFQRTTVVEVTLFEARLRDLARTLRKSFCKRRVEIWIDILQWNPSGLARHYGQRRESTGNPDKMDGSELEKKQEQRMQVSERFVQVLERMHRLLDNIATYLKKETSKIILSTCLEIMMRNLASSERLKGLNLSRIGILQAALDLKFLIKACEDYILSESDPFRYAKATIQSMVKGYALANNIRESEVLHPESFFDERIKDQLQVVPSLNSYTPINRHEKRRKNKSSRS